MSFFAITGIDSSQDFKISGCHFNLWCIPHKYFRQEYFCDVGLRLIAVTKEFDSLRIALPFKTAQNGFTDLSSLMLDKDTARLIFGREIETLAGNKIRYAGSSASEEIVEVEVVSVQKDKASYIKDFSGESFSVWQISFHRKISPGEKIYLRVRFKIDDPSGVWIWQGWGLAKRGALLDFRVCDVREAAKVHNWEIFSKQIRPIDKLNIFLIVPAIFFARNVTPAIYYLRLLEGSIWNRYINFHGSSYAVEKLKLAIYQWRTPATQQGSDRDVLDGPIGVDRPFRIFADLHQDFGFNLFLLYILALAVGPILSALINWWLR